jgi:hypothetical protein
LVWKLAAAHGTDPQARFGGRAGKIMLVRRVLWEAVHERAFPGRAIARCDCGTHLCVHPDHIIAARKHTVQQGVALPLMHRANIAKAKRARSDLSDAAVAAIRQSVAPLHEDADTHGIDPTYVSLIRRGLARRDYSNPYAALGAMC